MANSILDFLSDYKVRVTDLLDPPVVTATVEGTAGTTAYTYKASFVTLVGQSLCSDDVIVTTGNATLNGFNKIKLSVLNIPESVTYVRYWKYVDSTWVKFGDVTRAVGQIYDTGQSTTSATVPTENTSGRPGVIAVGLKPGQLRQRITDMDLQAIMFRKDQALWDTIFRDGDIESGCIETQITGATRQNETEYEVGDVITITTDSQFRYRCTSAGTSNATDPGSWPTTVEATKTDGDVEWTTFCDYDFTAGKAYLFGILVDVPSGTVNLTGSGTEVVGLTVTPIFSTADDDIVQRAGIDERCPAEAANTGPDWVYLELTWGVDVVGQVPVKEFLDGVAKEVTLPTERSALEVALADRTYDVSGSFVVENFPMSIVDHPTDATKLQLKIGTGTAYPNGFKTRFEGTRFIDFNKARDTKAVNESSTDIFLSTGGDCVGTVAETFNVNGKSLKFKVGSGAYHTVALTGTTETAASVGAQIAADLVSNSYPDILDYVAAGGYLQLKAENGKSLEISAPASNDAAPILGLAAGTYPAEGTRIYQLNNYYIKTVTDMSYKTDTVINITRSNVSDYDAVENLSTIVGIAATSVDCHDGKYGYSASVDYQRSVVEGVGVCIDWSLGGSEPVGGSTYYARVKQTYEPTKGIRQLCRAVDVPITKGAEDGQDNLTWTGAASITRTAINPSTGDPYGTSVTLSGAASDVIEIVQISNTAGQSVDQYTAYALLKNSTALAHNTSQVDWSAAGTPGTTGGGQPIGSGTYYVTFDFWYHVTEGDFVCADSYDSYTDIEVYSNIYLRDCLDFRTLGTWPGYGEDPGFDYEHYLSRIDKLTIDDNANFRLVTGVPGLNPITPPDQSRVLSLSVVRIPPYTYDKSNVSVVSLEPIRITQAGIQRMQERIERLEYWNTINDLEKEVSNKALYGLVGGESVVAEKQGVFTDALTGFSKIDLGFLEGGISHTAAIDRFERCLQLPASQDLQVIEVDLDNSVHVRQTANSIMLDYQPEVFMEQLKAGITVNGATDYTYENYYGHLKITPETDVFVDEAQLPQLNIDFDDNLAPLVNAINPLLANNVNWDSWNTTGVSSSTTTENLQTFSGVFTAAWRQMVTTTTNTSQTRTGTMQQLIPGSIQQDLGNRVVDLSLQGMMRSGVTISCDVVGLLPNVDHAVTMNGIACDLVYDATPVNASGGVGTHTYNGKTTVTASNTGTLTATFLVPSNIPIGNAIIQIFYYSAPDISTAAASYYTAGFRQSNQNTVIGVSSPLLLSSNVSENRIISDVSGEERFIGTIDPLAQTFIVRGDITYISAVGLFFSSKSATAGYTVQIRNVVNGYPGSQIYSSTTLLPVNIDVSDDSSVETVFTFDHVLGFAPNNEYCFVGIPSGYNTEYNLYAAELGTVDFLTAERIITQSTSADGVLLHSPNARAWDPWTKRDLKYKIYKSNFENDCQIVWKELTGVQASVLVLAVEEFIAPGTNVAWSYSLDSGVTWTSFNPGIDTDLGSIITKVQLRIDVTSLGGNYQIIDKFAGILLLYHDATANYVGNDQIFTDALNYPNKVTCSFDLDADGTNGDGITSVTPKFSIDDGETWVELGIKEGYIPVALDDPWYSYEFETPDEATVTGATNAEPIEITSAAHGFKDGAVVVVDSVGGNTNANGTWVVTNATTNTFELYTSLGVASVGNSNFTTGGTVTMAEFSQLRPLIYLETSNRARTPRVRNIGFIASRAA
jgi:hypothetical protein